ncbi:translation initiation factor IF-2 subunit gamma, partial [Candidatus Micrarchaeota archaeon]|nr:translation initiation factor IF-2 subunit gamma [Candidatus Micrarchaeota archaeon]
ETTVGFVLETKKNKVKITLRKPVCAQKNAKLAIMRRSGTRWHLYGTGKIV